MIEEIVSKYSEKLEELAQELLDRFIVEYNLIRKNLQRIAQFLAVRPGIEYFPCDVTLRFDCSELTKLDFARMFLLVARDYIVEKAQEKVKFRSFLKYLEHAGFRLGDLEAASVILVEIDKNICAAVRRTLDFIRYYAEKYEYLLLVQACRELRKCFEYDMVKIPDVNWFVSVTDSVIEHVGRLILRIYVARGTRPELAKEGELLERVYRIARDHAVKLIRLRLSEEVREALYREAEEIVKQQWRELIQEKSQEGDSEEKS